MTFEQTWSHMLAHPLLQEALWASGLAFAGWLSYFVAKRVLIRGVHIAAERTRNQWDDVLIAQGVFRYLGFLAPAMVLYFGAELFPAFSPALQRGARAGIGLVLLGVADRVLTSLLLIYNTYPISRRRPIKGYIQIAKIFLYMVGGIVLLSLLLDRSPWGFLSGVGALTAVLLFIFRDTLLSFIASLQIIGNDLVHVGDWIEMPKYGADGSVVEMALYTVKVQNWDKTITTIPTYKLVEDAFKNWRGMSESGGRRIKRALLIDQTSIRFCDAEMIHRFEKMDLLKPYVGEKKAAIELYNETHGVDPSVSVNGRRMTNIGTFRAYVEAYLRNHAKIRQDMTFIVRQLAPTPEGLPLEIYVFVGDVAWANYEAIQADIFDHLLAAVPEFGLKLYQRPSGADVMRAMDTGGPAHAAAAGVLAEA